MSIEQADKVDGMGIDRTSNEFALLISDHLPWSDEKMHFSLIENKIGNYINFIRSGQYLETAPQANGLPVRIKLIHEHAPTTSARKVLESIKSQLEAMKIAFSFEPLPTPY